MDEASLEGALNELAKQFGEGVDLNQAKLADLAKQAEANRKQLQKSISTLQELLDYLRVCIKYQAFDLEATRPADRGDAVPDGLVVQGNEGAGRGDAEGEVRALVGSGEGRDVVPVRRRRYLDETGAGSGGFLGTTRIGSGLKFYRFGIRFVHRFPKQVLSPPRDSPRNPSPAEVSLCRVFRQETKNPCCALPQQGTGGKQRNPYCASPRRGFRSLVSCQSLTGSIKSLSPGSSRSRVASAKIQRLPDH